MQKLLARCQKKHGNTCVRRSWPGARMRKALIFLVLFIHFWAPCQRIPNRTPRLSWRRHLRKRRMDPLFKKMCKTYGGARGSPGFSFFLPFHCRVARCAHTLFDTPLLGRTPPPVCEDASSAYEDASFWRLLLHETFQANIFEAFQGAKRFPWPKMARGPWGGKLRPLGPTWKVKSSCLLAKIVPFQAKTGHSEAKIGHFQAKTDHFEAKISHFESFHGPTSALWATKNSKFRIWHRPLLNPRFFKKEKGASVSPCKFQISGEHLGCPLLEKMPPPAWEDAPPAWEDAPPAWEDAPPAWEDAPFWGFMLHFWSFPGCQTFFPVEGWHFHGTKWFKVLGGVGFALWALLGKLKVPVSG